MPGLPWFKVASDFPAHPKTLRLCALLGDANAGMYVIRLLAYCATYAPDGRVPLDMIKQAAGWTKQRSSVELLTSSLVQAGFIVCTATHAEMHGWDEWNGAHVRKSAKDNARPRSDHRVPRAGSSRDDGGNSSGSRAGDVEGEKREREEEDLAPSASRSEPPPEPKPPARTLLSLVAALPPDAPPFARWLADTYPDIRNPVAFAVAQANANPGTDLLAEGKRALAWEVANPERRKRKHGPFLARWLAKEQDRARGGTRPDPTSKELR